MYIFSKNVITKETFGCNFLSNQVDFNHIKDNVIANDFGIWDHILNPKLVTKVLDRPQKAQIWC